MSFYCFLVVVSLFPCDFGQDIDSSKVLVGACRSVEIEFQAPEESLSSIRLVVSGDGKQVRSTIIGSSGNAASDKEYLEGLLTAIPELHANLKASKSVDLLATFSKVDDVTRIALVEINSIGEDSSIGSCFKKGVVLFEEERTSPKVVRPVEIGICFVD